MTRLTNAQQAERIAELEARIATQTDAPEAPAKTAVQVNLDSGSNARFVVTISGVDFVIHKGHLMYGKNPEGLQLLEAIEQQLYSGALSLDHTDSATVGLEIGKEKGVAKAASFGGVDMELSSDNRRDNTGGFSAAGSKNVVKIGS